MTRQFVFPLMTVLIAVMLAFLLTEIGYQLYLRLSKPVSVYQPAGKVLNPGGSGMYRGGMTRLDQHGFRNALDEAVLNRPYRVLVVGDSVAFGMGVDDADTVTHLLNDRYSDQGIGFVSIAYPGLDTVDLREVFAHYKKLYEPINGVIWIYHINDAKLSFSYRPPATAFRIYHPHPDPLFGIENELWHYVKSPTLIKHLLRSAANRLQQANVARVPQWENYYAMLQKSYHPRANTRATEEIYLAEIAEWTRAGNTPLLFVITPVSRQLEDNHTRPQDFVSSTLAQQGVNVFDVLKAMKRIDDPKTFFLPDDHAHWSAKGHEFVARILAPRISREMDFARTGTH